MKNIKPFTATLGMISLLFVLGCGTNSNFDEIYSLIEQKNFFQARNVYDKSKNGIALKYRLFIEAVLDNSFNSVNSSKKKVRMLEESGFGFPDSLQLSILDLKLDNAVKLYDYKQAKETAKYIVANYKELVDSNELKSYQNNFAMWAALEHIEKQRIKPAKSTRLKMKKDLAGLSTLSTFIQNDSIDFIFDTGATLSTTTREIAERFNMTIFPATVDIGTITGSKVKANLAVCEKLSLGGNEFFNVVFIVLPTGSLSFPEADYHIQGILGYPIFEALKEIKITRDGYFIVPEKQTGFSSRSNMALDGLKPLICIENKHFTFDTGANHSVLFSAFYKENKKEIDINYTVQQIKFWGAGGEKEFDGFHIEHTFTFKDKSVTLRNIDLLKEKRKQNETVYGNIGQDLIQHFNSMTINFEKMFINFED